MGQHTRESRQQFRTIIARVALITFLAISPGCSHGSEAGDNACTAGHAGGLQNPGKLSPDLSRLIREAGGDTEIAVLVRTDAPLTGDQKRALAGQGIHIGTIEDRVFTADLRLKDVMVLVEKPYVRFIELSKKLHLLGK